MDEFKVVIKSICILSAAICIIEGLSAGTRLKNQMKFLLDLIFITVLCTPVLKGTLSVQLPDIEQYMTPEYSDADTAYVEEMRRQTSVNISSVLKDQLEAAGIKCSNIEIDVNISETNSISINSVTVSADNFEAASEIIKNSLGQETEVFDGDP